MTSIFQPEQVDALLQEAGRASLVYLVGAGGCGMSGLGHLLLDLGHRVAGSDLVANEEFLQLQARSAQLHRGHDGEALRVLRPDLVVYSTAVAADNPELQAAQTLGLPVVPRAVLLAALCRRRHALCVAGMHGKTTTSAWLTLALETLGAQPSYAVGASVPQLLRHARFVEPPCTAHSWLVAETDESDGTLACFHPEHAILLNVDEEHLNHFRDLEQVCREFGRLAVQVRGWRIYCKDDPLLDKMLSGKPRTLSFGFDVRADYRVERASAPASGRIPAALGDRPTQRCAVSRHGSLLAEFATPLLGEKNLSNAAAVVALLHQLGFEAGEMARAMSPFQGATRRQQLLYQDERVCIYDDYGHHPTEIRATVRAFRQLGPKRLLVAFQPHRYTRTQRLLDRFADSFAEADEVWLTDIYPASEPPIPGVTGEGLAQAVRNQHPRVRYVAELGRLGSALLDALREGDLVLFLGAGDITKAAQEVAWRCRRAAGATVADPLLAGQAEPPGEEPRSSGCWQQTRSLRPLEMLG